MALVDENLNVIQISFWKDKCQKIETDPVKRFSAYNYSTLILSTRVG